MISITANKIAGLTPRWARFPGFSILFDPPSSAIREAGKLGVLNCDLDLDPGLPFFSLAAEGVRQLNADRLLQTFGFCALPSPSYHVTAFDVANVSDLLRCRAEFRDSLKLCLDSLPAVDAFDAEFLEPAVTSELATQEWNLTFGYAGLRRWGSVIAIELEPIHEEQFGTFLEARAGISRQYQQLYGVGADETFTPHLSLGYFMNKEYAELSTARLGDWDNLLHRTIGSTKVTFSTASLYGFTDMATFFRLPS